MNNEPTAVKVAHYVRGAFEGLGLGVIFLIPDLLVTAHRLLTSEIRSDDYLSKNGFVQYGNSWEIA